MRRDEIIRFLREQPFRPFRLRMSNDLLHEIRHPDMAIVTPSAVYIGIPATDTGGEAAEDIVVVSLSHVLQAEYLGPPPVTDTSSQPANP